MTATISRVFVFLVLVAIGATSGLGQSDPFTLSHPSGAALTFSEGSSGWRWTHLVSPQSPAGGWAVAEEGIELATPERTDTLNRGWTLVERLPDRVVLEQDAVETGLRLRRVFGPGPASNTVRIETWIQSVDAARTLTRITLLDAAFAGETFRETGPAPASFPLFGQTLFVGLEHISAECGVTGELSDRVRLVQRPRLAVGPAWQRVANAVVGWTQPGVGHGLTGEAGLRDAFLHYLDSVRLKPDRIVLHTDTWWTVPLPLTEKNLLGNIETLRKAFHERTGMFFDTYCVDLGWSDPRSLWATDTRQLANELRPVGERLAELGSRMGLWMSPGSGYPEALNNGWLQSQGYEMTPFGAGLGQVACFALGGRYQREFKQRIVEYARNYNLGHVILDFMAQYCDVATHGHPIGIESRYAIDAGLADVIDAIRAVNPAMVLEPMVCGYPPSPWWLTKTPFVLGPVGDDLPYGRGPCPDWQESLITARDIAYRAGQEAWLMPTQALETFDITVLSPGEFRNMAVMAIGRGRWFLSTYFNSNLMKPEDWDFLAALVRWARQNQTSLVNAWQIGGRPEDREAYGYMFRNPGRDLYCVRNPWIEERTIELPASATATEAREVQMIYPRRAVFGRIEPGQRGLTVTLAPYETLFLESVPAGETTVVTEPPLRPEASVTAAAPRLLSGQRVAANEEELSRIHYFWDGSLLLPDVADGELCVLVEGPPDVRRSTCEIMINGRVARVRAAASDGQFGAAKDASPENWSWFIVPIAPGETAFQIDLNLWLDEATVSVFVRGTTAATSETAPETGPAFPTFRADRRAWSQTLQPRQVVVAGSP
ncbi:alpha-amylase family protein [Horticoccus sp. 23ND18S-11]|uniref:hypothetical protein n=1 Tax=Horticoccus sp. 23ND18S-11 TaxID=3391832 RepID=UPI0039C951EF